MTEATPDAAADVTAPNATALVDSDVHPAMPVAALLERLPSRWREYLERYGLRQVQVTSYIPRPRAMACRTDAWPPGGGLPGSDLDFLREQLLDAWDVDYAVLNPVNGMIFAPQFPDFAQALTRALNDWVIEEWLDQDDRLRGSISVPLEHPHYAAREIERIAGDGRFAHVLVHCRTRDPLGDEKYWGMYEAATAYDLPLAIHVGGIGSNLVTGAGIPSYYIDDHIAFGTAIQTQAISLICQGVFERFPTLKVVLEEGGLAPFPPVMWGLDEAWKLLADEVSHLSRPPSETFREHFWFTTQPVEEPERPGDLMRVLEHLDMDDHILFSTDYPHWDFDAPNRALPRDIPDDLRRKIMATNACDLYRLPSERS